MAMELSVHILNGKTLVIGVKPDMSAMDVKRRIKAMHEWEDEYTCDTTMVDLILGNRKLKNADTVEGLGLSPDSRVSALFRKNIIYYGEGAGRSGSYFSGDVCNLGSTYKNPMSQTEAEARLAIVEVLDSQAEVVCAAFRGCDFLAEVIIPDTVKRIGSCAFQGCSSLTRVSIPESVTYIGSGAFSSCFSLASAVIPNSVSQIESRAFAFCKSLTSMTIPDSVRLVGSEAFEGCSLTRLTIPDSVTHIDCYAFAGCTSLTSVTIPESVTYLGFGAFCGCKLLTLRAPARLLQGRSEGCKMLATECGCGECKCEWFLNGWLCPHVSS